MLETDSNVKASRQSWMRFIVKLLLPHARNLLKHRDGNTVAIDLSLLAIGCQFILWWYKQNTIGLIFQQN